MSKAEKAPVRAETKPGIIAIETEKPIISLNLRELALKYKTWLEAYQDLANQHGQENAVVILASLDILRTHCNRHPIPGFKTPGLFLDVSPFDQKPNRIEFYEEQPVIATDGKLLNTRYGNDYPLPNLQLIKVKNVKQKSSTSYTPLSDHFRFIMRDPYLDTQITERDKRNYLAYWGESDNWKRFCWDVHIKNTFTKLFAEGRLFLESQPSLRIKPAEIDARTFTEFSPLPYFATQASQTA